MLQFNQFVASLLFDDFTINGTNSIHNDHLQIQIKTSNTIVYILVL